MCAPVVVVEDVGTGLEVGDGAGDFEDAVVCSRSLLSREQLFHRDRNWRDF